jgi:hypothetical protein
LTEWAPTGYKGRLRQFPLFYSGSSGGRGERGIGVSIEDKVLIEARFGPLWSGKAEMAFRGGVRTLRDVRRALDLAGEDVMAIDLHELPGEQFAFRYYDGDDRRVVVLVCDAEGGILEEFRAHIAEWLGELYYESGALAYDAEAMLHLLRKKTGEAGAPAGDTDR